MFNFSYGTGCGYSANKLYVSTVPRASTQDLSLIIQSKSQNFKLKINTQAFSLYETYWAYIRLRSFTFTRLWKQSYHRNIPEHPVQLPRHPTFFFIIFKLIWICTIPKMFYFRLLGLAISRLKQRSAVFTNLWRPYLPSTWHLERVVWRNKNEKSAPSENTRRLSHGRRLPSGVERRLNACVRIVHVENRWRRKT